jgi:hypothetical protein
VAFTTVSLDVFKALDVASDNTLEVTLDGVVAVNLVAKFLEVSFG